MDLKTLLFLYERRSSKLVQSFAVVAYILSLGSGVMKLQNMFLFILKTACTIPGHIFYRLLRSAYHIHTSARGDFLKFVVGCFGVPVFVIFNLLFEIIFNCNQRLAFNLRFEQALCNGTKLKGKVSDCVSYSGIFTLTERGCYQFFDGNQGLHTVVEFFKHIHLIPIFSNVKLSGAKDSADTERRR